MKNKEEKTFEQKMKEYIAEERKENQRKSLIAAEMNKQYANGKPSSD